MTDKTTERGSIDLAARAATSGTKPGKPTRPRRMAREPAIGTTDAEAGVPVPPMKRTQSKIAGVIALLSREQGATLAKLI